MSPSPRYLQPDPGLRRRAKGTLLIGGSPMKILRLSPGGAQVVDSWCRGEPVGPSNAATELSERLVSSGMFHPVTAPPTALPGQHPSEPEMVARNITVVIPVKDDPEGLGATLDRLFCEHDLHSDDDLCPRTVIVVDDGSDQAIQGLSGPHSIRIVRHPENLGPAAARMTGLAAVETEFVAFIDAGVIVQPHSLTELAALLAHEQLAAVAPRIVADLPAGHDLLSRYEAQRSPLDLGRIGGLVGPGRQIPYVPSACLVARTADVRDIGGFDSTLRFGEDVDLIWRLSAARAGSVRYTPTITAGHPSRRSVLAMAGQRFGYGTAAGPLFRRHGTAVSPVRTSWWSLAVACLLVAGRPMTASSVWAWTVRALIGKLPDMPDQGIEATLLASRGHVWTLRTLARNAVRTWWPVTLVALLAGPTRARATAVVGLGMAERLLDRPADPIVDLTLALVDDVSYGSGVWLGAWKARTIGPLLPDFIRWPAPE